MAPQYLLEGRSLDALTRKALELYGPTARIVHAERVLDGGLAGLMGRRHIEATVHVPGTAKPAPPSAAVPHLLDGRAGIAALLEDADRAETALHPTSPAVSTQAPVFDDLLRRLRADTGEPRVPALPGTAGELVLVVGRGGTALDVVRSIAAREPQQWALATAGDLVADWPHLEITRDAIAARADAVERSRAVLTAFSLGPLDALAHSLGIAATLTPDRVWLAVDARHKPDETAEWVQAASSLLAVDALAVVGAGETRTPHTVNGLGIPVGWVDGSPAPRTVL
ncbi:MULTISPECIES: hypothetical protein [Arthrobacter]|uniref:Uncharacterized protein n=2 Tax=Arthrobacter TaxID=1663 RepID=A0ABU9KIE9_9MICC|nr:hypothetical protein [Arthrobacter sp. YJM1]MDP5226324.1 hypothetical protein [Arthrobacter sp. YJM1]